MVEKLKVGEIIARSLVPLDEESYARLVAERGYDDNDDQVVVQYDEGPDLITAQGEKLPSGFQPEGICFFRGDE